MYDTLLHIGDALAIVGFAMLVYYFANKKKRTLFEDVLLVFSLCGLIADITFTSYWLWH
jgi:hypothetical protein